MTKQIKSRLDWRAVRLYALGSKNSGSGAADRGYCSGQRSTQCTWHRTLTFLRPVLHLLRASHPRLMNHRILGFTPDAASITEPGIHTGATTITKPRLHTRASDNTQSER